MMEQEQIIVARDGHEGIQMAYEHAPEVILMDLSLPKLDGWEVTRSLKSNPRFKDVPILALTAHAMVGDREAALQAGCDDFDTKPVNLPGLLERIRARGRKYERSINFKYLEEINLAFNNFFFHFDACPLLVVNASEIDFVHVPEDFEDLVEQIKKMKSGTQYYVPLSARGSTH